MNNSLAFPASRKCGFTLLELLVVIGIIGVLAAVTISQFGGATASAKATACMTNMRNLAVACQNTAMANDWGHYPAAGSYKWTFFRDGKVVYPTHSGWISWSALPNERDKGGGSTITFSSGSKDQLRFALTNGAIWRACGGSLKSYQCPVHAAACYKANKRYPGWSYVMNQDFGYDKNYGSGPVGSMMAQSLENLHGLRKKKGEAISNCGDRLLLFAEIQGVDVPEHGLKANVNGGGTDGDSVLQYDDKKESIGFNHQVTGKRWVAHVAFADGHVARILYPRTGMNHQELTQSLCMGHELSFDGSRYEDQTQSQ